jgi:hypothetical protein
MNRRRELADRLRMYGHNGDVETIRLVQSVLWDDLREEFFRLLESDTPVPGGQRKLMGMSRILDNFDQAVKNVKGQK